MLRLSASKPKKSLNQMMDRKRNRQFMLCMKQIFLPKLFLLGAGLLSLAVISSSEAGSFSTDFNSGKPAGATLYGKAVVDGLGGFGNSGALKLTVSTNNQQGSLVMDDLDGGKRISGFNATFKLRIGGGTGADGFSFNFAPDLPNTAFSEEGAGTGLSISFDTSDDGGGEAPAIDVKFGGVLIASQKFNPRTGDDFVDVVIKVDMDGGLDLVWGTSVVYTNLFAYGPIAGRFGIGARTGGLNDNHFVDDLKITTTPLNGPYVKSLTPRGIEVRPYTPIIIELQAFNGQVNPATLQVAFDGATVVPLVSKESELTTIQFTPSGLLRSGSAHSVSLTYQDSKVPPVSSTAQFNFAVEKYSTIPSSFNLGANAMDTNKIGFRVRTVQARNDVALAPTLSRAERQLAGTLIDPVTNLPYQNEAIPGTNSVQSYDEQKYINYEPEKTPVGSFLDDEAGVPGIPGIGDHTDNFAVEILTYLDLPAGYNQFGVNSDDGFKVTVGEKDARDAFSMILGQFDGARSVADSLFSFIVESAGVYSFRVAWLQSSGESGLEFFSLLEDGTKVLINDGTNGSPVNAFREVKSTVPSLPLVQSVSPKPGESNVSRKPQVSLAIRDQRTQVVVESIQMEFNGIAVKPTVSKTSGTTLINFQPVAALSNSSSNTLRLFYQDNAAPPNGFLREWHFTTAPVIPAKGLWDFDNASLSATIGQDLEYGDTAAKEVSSLTQFGSTTSFGIPDINGKPAKVMKLRRNPASTGIQPGFVMKHGVAPTGAGTKVNRWTLIMDMLFPDPQDGRFSSIIQTDDATSDGDMLVRWNNIGGDGTGGLGVNGQFTGDGRTFLVKGKWHRIALAVDLTSTPPLISKFIDGVKFEDQFLTAPQQDGRFALGKTLRLFADNDNQLNTIYVNSIEILDGKLIDDEIAALGGPSPDGISNSVAPPPTRLPALATSRNGINVILSWPAEFTGFVLESTDSLVRPLWVPVTGITNNSVTVRTALGSKFFRLRK
jgi:hypothetical protein